MLVSFLLFGMSQAMPFMIMRTPMTLKKDENVEIVDVIDDD